MYKWEFGSDLKSTNILYLWAYQSNLRRCQTSYVIIRVRAIELSILKHKNRWTIWKNSLWNCKIIFFIFEIFKLITFLLFIKTHTLHLNPVSTAQKCGHLLLSYIRLRVLNLFFPSYFSTADTPKMQYGLIWIIFNQKIQICACTKYGGYFSQKDVRWFMAC